MKQTELTIGKQVKMSNNENYVYNIKNIKIMHKLKVMYIILNYII